MLALNPQLEKKFYAFFEDAVDSGVLSERERILVVLASSLLLEDDEAVKNTVLASKQLGVTHEEIGHVSAIVVALRGQKINRFGNMKVPTPTKMDSTCCE